MTDISRTRTILHATTVSVKMHALVILGPSGSGKSALGLDLIALGADLVADDRTCVHRRGSQLIASAPASIAGRIEARHIGLLALPHRAEAEIVLAIDLGREESHRLPPLRHVDILGQNVTLLYRPPGVSAASAILQCLTQRRTDP